MTTQQRRNPGYIHGRSKNKLDWFVDAVCRADDVDMRWFHPEDFPNRDQAVEKAKNVCAPCPVADLCLEYGNAVSPDFGIWSGLTPTERRRRITRAGVA
jgi:WhiB family transcriptional regulator, redox-sensing transcriptional regulator